MAVKINKADYELIFTVISKTVSNYAHNGSVSIEFGDGQAHAPRGYIGVIAGNPKTLHGALTTGIGSSRINIEFEITPILGGTSIQMSHSSSMSLDERTKTVKNFLIAHKQKIIKRMVDKHLYPSRGGGDGSLLLKGHHRGSRPGSQTEFNDAIQKGVFSNEFVVLANLLNIRYQK